MDIRFSSVEDIFALRAQVLRPGLPIIQSYYPFDEDSDSFHLSINRDNKAVAVISFLKESSPKFDTQSEFQYRIRGVSTYPDYRNRGFASNLIAYGEQELRKRHCKLVWLNAREVAVEFYKKREYLQKGDYFEIPNIGPHVLMYKVFD